MTGGEFWRTVVTFRDAPQHETGAPACMAVESGPFPVFFVAVIAQLRYGGLPENTAVEVV